MKSIRLVHWHEGEAQERIEALCSAGYDVRFDTLKDSAAIRRIREEASDAVVIDLSRLPSQGRDLALWLRRQKATRTVPLVFVEGDSKKVAAIKDLLPDAVYTDWHRIRGALKWALRHPPDKPIAPSSPLAGYAGTPLPKKLRIREGSVVALAGAPEGFEQTLGPLPEGAILRFSGRGRRNLTIFFFKSRRELQRGMERVMRAASQGNVWIAWPKKGSPLAGDLGQADVRRIGLAAGLVDFKVCSIDETWAGLCFARRKR